MIARLRWLYFLYYAGVGTFLSYFAPYLRGLGFSGEEIGVVTFAQQAVAAPSALIWGGIADRLGAPSRALAACTAGMLFAVCGLPFARTPGQVGVVLVLSALFSGAVVPLLDSTAVEAVKRVEGQSYARTRLWGSIGFVLTAQGLGLLLALRGDRPGDRAMPYAYLSCVGGYALLAQVLPAVPAHPERPQWRDALVLLREPRLLFVFSICAIHWTASAPYHLLFGVLVRDLGLSSTVTGAGLALGVVAEIFALLAFPRMLRRFSLRALFAAAFAGTALRWALLARAHGAPALIGLQLLHALSFGVFWGTAVEAMQRIVPARLRATGQALFSALVFALGNALGYALSGAGYDRFGSAGPLYTVAAAVELLPLLLLLLPLSPEKPDASTRPAGGRARPEDRAGRAAAARAPAGARAGKSPAGPAVIRRSVAGYSGTPLPQKLGIKDGARVRLARAPDGFAATLGIVPRARGEADVIVLFTRTAAGLSCFFPRLRRSLHDAGGLWVAWPKQTSGVRTDLSEGVVRQYGLAQGLVDNKVCAIDETWSGLRFVVRLSDRR